MTQDRDMMRSVWKFPVFITDSFDLMMPVGARPLFVAVDVLQDGPFLWAEVDFDSPVDLVANPSAIVAHRFHVVGTGNPIPQGATYIGTFIQSPFVWHLYDGGEI